MDIRELSKKGWNAKEDTLEAINAGSLLRIADASEKMAANYAFLEAERDRYKRWYQDEMHQNARLYKRIQGLRGRITFLKKKAAK